MVSSLSTKIASIILWYYRSGTKQRRKKIGQWKSEREWERVCKKEMYTNDNDDDYDDDDNNRNSMVTIGAEYWCWSKKLDVNR